MKITYVPFKKQSGPPSFLKNWSCFTSFSFESGNLVFPLRESSCLYLMAASFAAADRILIVKFI